MLQLALVVAMLAAVPATCAGDQFDAPGQGNYRATLTVFNRTEREISVISQARTIQVPPCGEVTAEDMLINWWQVTSPGRDMIHSGGGQTESHSYLIVTNVVRQLALRPLDLPPCQGLLQPGG